ncbi:MAG: metal ABC transporter substrate-binding protein [Lachnospiraceae bacterium]|nr:metal ABC transporter substrate-binding protein [Lachnospiraceae bacterium]
MKKYIGILVAAILVACNICGCASSAGQMADSGAQSASASDADLRIVTTIFPEYDWVCEVLGDRADSADVTMLLNNGVDLHSFQPTADDILKIASCDVFIYVGGESDEWVDDALKEAVNKDMVVINLLEVLGDIVKTEEIVEGMEHKHDHEDEDHDHEDEDHDHEDEDHDHEEEDHDHEHEEELDEHVWLSLRNAAILTDAIADGLAKADPDNADSYRANADAYKSKLGTLDKEYTAAVEAGSVHTLLFGDRFPFRYMVDDYGLDYYAAFAGCSAETEASFETIVFLADKTDELGLGAIMTIEGTDHSIAETVRDNTSGKDQQILTLDSMQSTTLKDAENGTTYLSVMTSNLEVLKEALK